MPAPKPSTTSGRSEHRERQSSSTVAAFVIGPPLAAAILYVLHFGPLHDTAARRYVSHPVEFVEVIMFCCALGALLAKLVGSWRERRACRVEIAPAWDGQIQPLSEAPKLLSRIHQLPKWMQTSRIVRRTTAVLNFLCSRRSAAELDDHLRTLADNDAIALEGSYSLTRFITWAIPILGFLGTVVGITGAISGVTPEVLEQSLSTVTDGLALAFDATALALGLTMLIMFLSFIVERAEQGVLDTVDQYVDREWAHRFERAAGIGGEFVEVVRRNSEILVEATERLVERQAAVWAKALEEVDRRRGEAEQRLQDRLTSGLEAALEKTLESHTRRLQALEKHAAEQNAGILDRLANLAAAVKEAGQQQQSGLTQVAHGVAAQIEALAQLQEGEQQLLRLQESLNQNLSALSGAGAFEEAVHSLSAAVHLLTGRLAPAAASRQGVRPGAAA